MKGVSLKDYFEQKVDDGVEGLTIHGVPKSGKSNMAIGLCDHLMNNYNENLIIPGDINCEWRHLISNKSVKECKVLVPKELEGNIELFNVDKSYIQYVDYSTLKIKDYLVDKDTKAEKTNFMLVIYDAHFQGPNFYLKIKLWNEIAKQLIQRTFLIYTPIILLFHEAGVYFPQISIGNHFQEVYNFSQYVVDFRKSLVRLILISQLDSEIVNTIWYKNYWTIYRKGYYSKRVPSDIRDQTPFYGISKYVISYGNIYTPNNRVKRYNECNEVWKMINTLEIKNNNNDKENIKFTNKQLDFMLRLMQGENPHQQAKADKVSHQSKYKIKTAIENKIFTITTMQPTVS